MALFDVRNISFSQNGKSIVDDISLTIESGTVNGFVGKSGCGKTTLVKLISGILVPTSGSSLFEGRDIQTMSKNRNLIFRKKCSFVFQDSALWANQDIMSNLMLPLQIHFPKMSMEERQFTVNSICAMVNFTKPLNLRPADLSTGEQKKVAFARAMICGPEILFLDEVTSGLDEASCEIIVSLLKNFVENGNTLLYVSHDNDFINEFPGNLFVIEDGKLKGKTQNVSEVYNLLRNADSSSGKVEDGEINIDGIMIKI